MTLTFVFLHHLLFVLQEGIALLQSSIEPKQERYGDLSAQVADTWKLIGSAYLSTGDADQALGALKKVRGTYKFTRHGLSLSLSGQTDLYFSIVIVQKSTIVN